ncbi:MAG: family 16 glycosylhydrolase [Bacteroidales bacterium]|nr:family 16 glycosylhydrolase [Bacteroidales bacterium]
MSAKFSLYAKLGMIPKTSVLEEKENKLKQEFEDFNAYKESEELARFNQLNAFITSKEFEDIKREINAKKYQGSEIFNKEKAYKDLKKSKRIKTFYQVKDSQELKTYDSFKDSDKLANYEELNLFFTSPEFDEFKKSLIQQKDEKTKQIKDKQLRYKELKKKFKGYFALKVSKQLADCNNLDGSKELNDFQSLKEYIEPINFDVLKTDIENKKKEKQEELNTIISRFKDLKRTKKSLKKAEEFPENDEFEELQRKIHSKEYQKAIKEIKVENLDEYQKLKEYQKLEQSSKIKNHFKFKNSEKYKKYLQLDGSEEIESYIELEKEVNSPEFKSHIEEVKKLKFAETDEFKKQQEYKALKKSSEIKQYYKFHKSEKLTIYSELNESQEITDYEELEQFINSEEFKNEKKYLLTKDKFKLSEEFKQEEEYKKLKKSDKIKWYQKLEKQNNFDKLSEWELTFEDRFEGNKLDADKWMTGYYWGKNLLNDDYVQVSEKQFYKDSNIELNNNTLKISTKQEKVNGKVWDPAMGFYTKDFDYTSGLIQTGQSFRQQYGLFKAKVKVNHSYPVHHAFWLLGEKITPEIDIFKFGKKSSSKIELANYWNGDQNKKAIGGLNFAKDYFIYSLEWTSDKLIWKVNDVVLFEQTEGIPQEPMYIVLSSGIHQEGQTNGSLMEIDWVRVYKK